MCPDSEIQQTGAGEAPSELPPRLRAFLPVTDAAIASARARYVLRAHVLERIAQALRDSGVRAVLVKGAALALSVYSVPWQREMADIDLIVSIRRRDDAVSALVKAGFSRIAVQPGRWLSDEAFGEIGLVAEVGGLSVLVEVHTSLDKVGARPVDYAEIAARSTAAPGLEGLLVPSLEDQVLLVALHSATSEFRHPIGFVDLELLLRAGADLAIVAERGRAWKLETALFLVFATLCGELGSTAVPADWLEGLAPRGLRRWAISRIYSVGAYPVVVAPYEPGWTWMMRQVPLRDDTVHWLAAIGRYAGLRLAERALPR